MSDNILNIKNLSKIYHDEKKETLAIDNISFEIKDKTAFTESSRKYIGVLKIFGTNYRTFK